MPARRAAVLVEEAEGALLRLVALARQVLERLATRQHLATAHNTTVLVLNEVILVETTGSLLRRAVENLGLGTYIDAEFGGHLIHLTAILFASAGVNKNLTWSA